MNMPMTFFIIKIPKIHMKSQNTLSKEINIDQEQQHNPDSKQIPVL